ncbi:MAG: DUF3276 family protein [Parabacteroides sp.]|nr:DUF3276 family protein [Parabacteroides sp.]
MEESERKVHVENGDKEIIYSKAIKAGKRIYYLDVKKNLKNDLFLAITESKKIQPKNGNGNGSISFEKHKIFLYKEDFVKFMDGMEEVINYIRANNPYKRTKDFYENEKGKKENTSNNPIKLDIDF